jgi:prolyl-tRNA editing enzyme YbaK/EbsC (Cys-tRNA(Pro) deacylase)
MLMGGVTPFGLPPSLLPVRVDGAVLARQQVVVGGGNRSVKLVVEASVISRAPHFEVIEGLAARAMV